MKLNKFFAALLSLTNVVIIDAQALTLVKDINPSLSSNPRYLQNFNNKMYFVANPNNGFKLFSSDGTEAGTQQIGPSVGSGGLEQFIAYNNTLFFNYDDGINGPELWKSDGTSAGTVLVKDIVAGSSGSNPQYLAGTNGKVFFIAGTKLWTSDGTSNGTVQLTGNNMVAQSFNNQLSLAVYNNNVYFSGNNNDLGLWKSDGTLGGTQLLKTIRVNAYLEKTAIFNNEMYFAASDNINGYELWKTNGTTAGTVMIKNISAAGDSNPNRFLVSNNKIFFLADDGVNGEELWISDGTSAGTQIVKDISSGNSSSNIQNLIEYNGQVYFFVLNNNQRLLYKTDGTSAGTVLVKTIPFGTVPYAYVSGGKLYFFAKGLGSSYLFISDGTSAGTYQFSPGISSEYYSDFQMLTYNAELYLPCYNGNTGVELNKFTSQSLATLSEKKEAFSVYPNPTSDRIWIKKPKESKTTSYQILDFSGKVLEKNVLKLGDESVSLQKFPSGVYIIRITSGEITEEVKVLKK